MILTCQNCSTSFRLDERLLKSGGAKVRCSRCKHIWRARPPVTEGSEPESPVALDEQPDNGVAAASGLAAGLGAAALLAGDAQTTAESAEVPAASAAASSPPELKLGLDDLTPTETPGDNDDVVTDEINLDELDLLLEDDDSRPSGPEPVDGFETEELDIADLENILDSDVSGDAAPATPPPDPGPDDLSAFEEETEDSIIEDLDFDMGDLESLLDDEVDTGEAPARVENEDADADGVKLDLAPELEDLLEDDEQDLAIEETEEIGLSELKDTPPETDAASTHLKLAGDDDIDLELASGLDRLFDEGEDQDIPLEETEELDFAALEDEREQGGAAAEVEDPSSSERDLGSGAVQDPGTEAQQPDVADDQKIPLSLEDEASRTAADEVEELDLGNLESVLEGESAELSNLSPGEEHPELVLDLEGDTNESADVEELDLALDDIDLDLDAPEPAGEDENNETRELDLDEFEGLLESADASSKEAPEAESLELDLDLDGEAVGDGADEGDDATRELNLDDIEKILGTQDADPATAPSDPESEEDLDLALDMEDDAAAPEVADTDVPAAEENTDGGDALDLSELEKLLNVEDTTDSPSLTADDVVDDLDLDFELQPSVDEGDELELEFDMLEDEAEESSALFDTSESEDLGLDLDIAETPATEKIEAEGDLELEIMDADGKDDLVRDAIDTDAGDLELDTPEDDAGSGDPDPTDEAADAVSAAAPVAAAAAGAASAAASRDLTQELMDEMAAADTQTMKIPPAEAKPAKPVPTPQKKKSNKLLLFLLLLVLLGAAAYFVFSAMGSGSAKFKLADLPQIPFVSEWLGGKKAPEAIVPIETTLKGSWVQNVSDGRLYIIQGQVKNEYSEPRSFIRVTGHIFADGRQFKRAAQAYCGNMPSRVELEKLPVADLQKMLGNRSGANNINVNVAPNKDVPFTIVFSGLPNDVELQEYAVEISGSLPATKAKSN